jgi:hypothetical protein
LNLGRQPRRTYLVDTHHELEKKFEDEKQNALEALRNSWLQELKAPEEQLLEVAPIFGDDVDSIPTRRAAYSDRTAAMMAKVAMLAYIAFEDADKKKILDGILTHGRVKLLETIAVSATSASVPWPTENSAFQLTEYSSNCILRLMAMALPEEFPMKQRWVA